MTTSIGNNKLKTSSPRKQKTSPNKALQSKIIEIKKALRSKINEVCSQDSNSSGLPFGNQNKSTRLADQRLECAAESLTRAALAYAGNDNPDAQRILSAHLVRIVRQDLAMLERNP